MITEETIALANKAGWSVADLLDGFGTRLERFANLVAAAEREACLDAMLKSTGKAVDVAMALEREACALICESRGTPGTGSVAILAGAADAIRARSQS